MWGNQTFAICGHRGKPWRQISGIRDCGRGLEGLDHCVNAVVRRWSFLDSVVGMQSMRLDVDPACLPYLKTKLLACVLVVSAGGVAGSTIPSCLGTTRYSSNCIIMGCRLLIHR